MRNIILFLCFFYAAHVHAQTTVDDMDLQLLLKLEHSRTNSQTHILRTFSDANNYVNAAIPISLFVAGVASHNKDLRQNALYIASSAASTALLNVAIKQIFKRHRPFEVHATLTPVYRPDGYSFPSGHTSLSFATATALSRAYPKWYVIVPAFLWAGTVGYSRLYLGVHNPSDVFTGAVLGIGAASALSFIKQ
jgi:membrane-associated phospholipid phosphatase